MKKISIDKLSRADKFSIRTSDHYHTVFLGNNVRAHFSSIVKARKFLADTNRFLNQKLHEINDLYAEIYSVYTKLWFIMDDEIERSILYELQSLPKSRRLAVERSSWQNGNHFTFTHLLNCLSNLTRSLDYIIQLNTRYNRHTDNYTLQSLQSRLKFIEIEIEKYGQEHHIDWNHSDFE